MTIYLYIMEDGELFQSKTPPTRQDIDSVHAGILDVIVTNGVLIRQFEGTVRPDGSYPLIDIPTLGEGQASV